MKFVPIVVIVIALAAAAYFFFSSGNGGAPAPVVTKPNATAPGTAAPAAAGTAAPAAPVPEMSKEQLIKEAGTAFREQRYVAPTGNNALEYYLRVLDKDPNNQGARDALREGFPFFTGPAEQYINAGNVEEANRVIELLTKVDPNNFTLNILRSKLEAKKKQVDHDQQVAAAAAARAATTPAQAVSNPNATAPATAPVEAAPTPAATPAPAQTAAATPPPPVARPTPAPAPVEAPAAPSGETHAAELVRAVQPDYPPEAYRSRAQGWVEVEFTVGADGAVSNAQVVNAEPSRVFNTAALNAVKRWTFKPKLDNGKAVDERMRRRIEFKLGG
ncbi:MAG: energy transducer TonB [Rudaea sp.]